MVVVVVAAAAAVVLAVMVAMAAAAVVEAEGEVAAGKFGIEVIAGVSMLRDAS